MVAAFLIRHKLVWLMPPSQVQRRTANDTETFLSQQFWVDEHGELWWDLRYIHRFFINGGWCSRARKRKKWIVRFFAEVEKVGPAAGVAPNSIDEPACETRCWLMYVWLRAGHTTAGQEEAACLDILRNVCRRATSKLCNGHGNLHLHGQACQVLTSGTMLGFKKVFDSQHRLLQVSWESGWEHMRSINALHGPFHADTHNVVDVAMFLCLFLKQRRRRHKTISNRTTRVMSPLVVAFVCWLAAALTHLSTQRTTPQCTRYHHL